jgi:hypothetical protein
MGAVVVTPVVAGVCAEHPDRRAKLACARCGTYGCASCTLRTSCRRCLERVIARHRVRARLVQLLALIYLAEAGGIAALTIGTFGLSVQSGLMLAGTAAPLALVGYGLYRFDSRAWLLGVALTTPTLAASHSIGAVLLVFAGCVLLPRAGKEILSPLYTEAREAVLEIDQRSESWLPITTFLLAGLLFFPWHRRPHASHADAATPQLLMPVLLLALLFAFSRGRGWSGRARTQLMLWASIGFAFWSGGAQSALGAIALLVGLLYVATRRQRFPTQYPGREQPVDNTRFVDLDRVQEFLNRNGFQPLCQCVTAYAMGTVAEDVYMRTDGTICRLASVAASSVTACAVYLETWFGDGCSLRSCDQLRHEDINDRQRHALHWRAVKSYDELLAQHAERCRAIEPLRVTSVEYYLRLRRAAYDDSFRSALRAGIVLVRGDVYRYATRGCLRVIARAFNLKAALADESVS